MKITAIALTTVFVMSGPIAYAQSSAGSPGTPGRRRTQQARRVPETLRAWLRTKVAAAPQHQVEVTPMATKAEMLCPTATSP